MLQICRTNYKYFLWNLQSMWSWWKSISCFNYHNKNDIKIIWQKSDFLAYFWSEYHFWSHAKVYKCSHKTGAFHTTTSTPKKIKQALRLLWIRFNETENVYALFAICYVYAPLPPSSSFRVRLPVARLTDPAAARTLRAVRDDLGHVALVVRIGVLLDAQHTEATHTSPMQLHQRMAVRMPVRNVRRIDVGQVAEAADRLRWIHCRCHHWRSRDHHWFRIGCRRLLQTLLSSRCNRWRFAGGGCEQTIG